MADSRDITGKNRKFKGTDGIVLPKGTQAERADTESGEIRFNTDTNLAEYYDGAEWKPIDAPPTITAVSPASPADDGSTVTEITITGSNLQSGGTLSIIGNDTTVYNVASFTRVSSSSITFNYTSALAAAGVNTPYDIRYENPSGLAATLEDGFTPNTGPVWQSPAAGSSLGTINIGANASTLTQISVTDTTGGTLVYSIISGALPDGAIINSSTGAISGVTTASGTFTFTIQVTDGTTAIDRQFTATVVNPYITATGGTVTESGDYKIHTFTGDGCFVVSNVGSPAGSDTVSYMVVAGGGSAGGYTGAGAGGFREGKASTDCYSASPLVAPAGLPVTATTYPIIVGAGGAGVPSPSGVGGNNGSNSVFSTITSAGGGGGSDNNTCSPTQGQGGSGGGGYHASNGCATLSLGASGNVPPVSPPQGNPGGAGGRDGVNGPNFGGGGGGGAGAVGGTTSPSGAGSGGNGATTSISGSSSTYAGGGGGGGYPPLPDGTPSGGTGGGGPGGYGPNPSPVARFGVAGSANTGGGSGASPPGQTTSSGGSGIVIIRYKYQ